MTHDRRPKERQPIAAAVRTSITVGGLVHRPAAFTAADLSALAIQPLATDRAAITFRLPIVDLLSMARLDHRAELLMATDVTGRSLALPLRVLLSRRHAQLVVESVAGRAPASDGGLVRPDQARPGIARLRVAEWTYEDEPFWVDDMRAMTFAEFLTPKIVIQEFAPGRRTTPIPWQHGGIAPIATDPNALMQRVQEGDRVAFADLYDALAPQVFGVIKRVLRDPAMSEEVSQEVFVEMWSTAARFDATRASVGTWAITMARRRAVDRVRREQSQRNRLAELQQQPTDGPEQPEAVVVTAFANDEVTSALAQLPEDQREVIELAFIEGLAHGAIATRLDLPLGTVKGRVRGGLKRLRTIMDGHEIGASG